MADTVTESQVIPLLAEWDVDPEASSQVYWLPKDCKQLQEANL